MLKKVLVANRGEIALRIIRACRDLGIGCVAVYSQADRGRRFVYEADEAIEIGPGPARQSYLAVDRLIDAAKRSGADAVHPGYGFLSENAEFAKAVEDAGLIFVGPPSSVIAALGSKLSTRRIMIEAGVPVLPGTDAIDGVEEVAKEASKIGFPLLVKPSGGGGGRGMRLVERPEDLPAALEAARREAASSFKDSDVYLEKLLPAGRHIEVQILADGHGNVVHLGNRDCSMQRRHQKLVEEAPAPGLSAKLSNHVCELAVRAAVASSYVNAGTVEFLYDGVKSFFILEVNTRIQVEHPVSEQISGIDLVAEQLRIAGGERLGYKQQDIALRGHALECRIYAENPQRNFMPSTGRISAATFPSGPWVRDDRGIEVGDEITPHYDGMLSKLIAWGPSREVALARLLRALREYRLEGIETNIEFLRWLLNTPAFREVKFDTGFIGREFRPENLPAGSSLPPPPPPPPAAAPAAAPAPATAPPAGMRAEPVGVFHYHRTSQGIDQDYLIHAVVRRGEVEAIPLSPADLSWAQPKFRRTAPAAQAAVGRLIDEVLERLNPDEIFPDLSVPY